MRFVKPVLHIIALLILGTTLRYLAFHYMPASPGFSPPLHVMLVDAVNVIIHEAGHFFFRPFGYVPYFMGGSIFQILFAFGITLFVWFKQREYTAYPLFWTGWNMMHVAVYISDAPFRKLHLLGKGCMHDWYVLMNRLDLMDDAVTIGAVVHWLGVLVCVAAIVHGVVVVIREFKYG
jgi:hypothetical protein